MESGFSESQLVSQAKNGCNSSFNELAKSFGSFIGYKAKVYYLEGGDNGDVQQECLVGLLNAVRDYDFSRKCGFKTFAKLCIDRHLISSIKSANCSKHKVLNEAKKLSDLDSGCLLNSDADPYFVLKTKETIALLTKQIDNLLSGTENTVLSLHCRGLSYSEISLKTTMSVKSVDNALQRARQKIQRLLDSS